MSEGDQIPDEDFVPLPLQRYKKLVESTDFCELTIKKLLLITRVASLWFIVITKLHRVTVNKARRLIKLSYTHETFRKPLPKQKWLCNDY